MTSGSTETVRVGAEVLIRRAKPNEHNAIRALVQAVLDEIYGGASGLLAITTDQEDWSLAWVAISGAGIVGIVLTHDEWVSDLWVLPENRGVRVGQRLLAQAEDEIMGRGHQTLRLRVEKSNQRAVHFYERQGWQIAREFPHEKLPVMMLEMTKLVIPS